jgi:tetratricopeptide (TPR) repeat protein
MGEDEKLEDRIESNITPSNLRSLDLEKKQDLKTSVSIDDFVEEDVPRSFKLRYKIRTPLLKARDYIFEKAYKYPIITSIATTVPTTLYFNYVFTRNPLHFSTESIFVSLLTLGLSYSVSSLSKFARKNGFFTKKEYTLKNYISQLKTLEEILPKGIKYFHLRRPFATSAIVMGGLFGATILYRQTEFYTILKTMPAISFVYVAFGLILKMAKNISFKKNDSDLGWLLLQYKLGKKDYVQKALEKFDTKKNPFYENVVDTRLSEIYFSKGEYDEAFSRLSKLFKTIPEQYEYDRKYTEIFSDFRENINFSIFYYAMKKHGKFNSYLALAAYYMKKGIFDKAAETFKEGVEKNKSVEANILFGLFLDYFDKKELAQEQWSKTIDMVLSDQTTQFENITDSRNKVYKIGRSKLLRNTFVFKENKDKNILEKEKELTELVSNLIRDNKNYSVPKPLAEIRMTNDSYFYVMKQNQGNTLLELMDSKDYNTDIVLENTVDYLAYLHSVLTRENTSLENVSMPSKLKNRLRDHYFNISSELQFSIISNYRPVFKSLENADYVFIKDAHPQNWIYDEDKKSVVAIDFEPKGFQPIQTELTNLLEYTDYMSDEKKIELMKRYVSDYTFNTNCNSLNIDYFEKFLLGYYNAVIDRAITLSSVWSSPDRTSFIKKRGNLLKKAIKSIDHIKDTFTDYYKTYSVEYENLKSCLSEIKVLVDSGR